MVIVCCKGRAAKVWLILVISARLVISQLVESALMEKIDKCGTFVGCEAVAVVLDGSFGVVDGLGLMDGLRIVHVVGVMGGVGVLVVGHASFEVDQLLLVLGGAPVAKSFMLLRRDWKEG